MITPITTRNAPAAIGAYSQAVRCGDTVYLSGQIPLDPTNMELVGAGFEEQARQAFCNLCAVIAAAGGTTADVVKLTVYLTDMNDFPTVNAVMMEFFDEPYPARAAVGIAELPRRALIEIEGVLVTRHTRKGKRLATTPSPP